MSDKEPHIASSMPEAFSTRDALRQELEGKIEKKLDAKFFYWSFAGTIGAIIVVGLWFVSSLDGKIQVLSEKNAQINDKVIVIETLMEK